MFRQKRLAAAALLLVCTVVSFAQGGFKVKARSISELQSEQRQLLSGWCRQDFDGARLSADSWQRMSGFTVLRNNPDFRKVIVVSRYEIQPSTQYSTSPSVAYYVVGEYEPGVGYIPLSDRRDATFRIVTKDDRLLVAEVDPVSPFVSRPALLKYLAAKESAATSDAERAEIKSAITAVTSSQTGATAK